MTPAQKSAGCEQVPTVYTVTLDGKDLAAAAAKIDLFETNPNLPAETFRITK